MCVVAPEALNRFYLAPVTPDRRHMDRIGAAWLTREDREHEIIDANLWLDAVHRDVVEESGSSSRPQTTVLAFSQGVATAMRWIMKGAVRPRHVVFWAGGTATDIDQSAFAAVVKHSSFTYVAGDRDEFLPPAIIAKIIDGFTSSGVTPEFRSFSGGHQLNRELLAELISSFISASP